MATRVRPEIAEGVYQKSVLHCQEGNWQQAITGFELVLQLRPEHAEAQVLLEETRIKAALDQRQRRSWRWR